jgi:hypothetical protein
MILIYSNIRFEVNIPEEDAWIPSDQTIHWGKRPNYIYPAIKLIKKDEITDTPRGTRLVAKLWFTEWSWDEEKEGRKMKTGNSIFIMTNYNDI